MNEQIAIIIVNENSVKCLIPAEPSDCGDFIEECRKLSPTEEDYKEYCRKNKICYIPKLLDMTPRERTRQAVIFHKVLGKNEK